MRKLAALAVMIATATACGSGPSDEPTARTTLRTQEAPFLSYPLDQFFMGVTCDYDCYYTQSGSPHAALDFTTGLGRQVVRAAAAGEMTVHGQVGGCGNMITIDVPNGYQIKYCHFSEYLRGSGPVRRGEAIGRSGATGYTDPPGYDHVHFQVIDPSGARVSPGCPPGAGGMCNDAPGRSLWLARQGTVLKANEPLAEALADFDADGCSDVLGRRTSDKTLRLYAGNCAAGYSKENEVIGQQWSDFEHLMAVDFSGDGCVDVVGRRKSDLSLRMYPGACDGHFAAENQQIGSSWGDFDWLGGGDFDGDGCADILGRRSSDRSLRLYSGNCASGYVKENVKIGHEWGDFEHLMVADFSGDGCDDVIGRRRSDRSLRLFAGNCAGGWLETNRKIGHEWGDFDQLLARDFDGDGCIDVIGRRASDRSLRLYAGSCTGGWLETNRPIGTAWGDFDALF
ncbi:MAG: M23 family metallopeptidase [Polyangiaceae bacterium]